MEQGFYQAVARWSKAAILLLAASLLISRGRAGGSETAPKAEGVGVWNVREAGAKGDGQTDDTAVFQQLLDLAGKSGGGVVFVPAGRYRIAGSLRIPANVRLEGVFRYAPTVAWHRREEPPGSVLLAFAGRGQPEGPAFIRLAGMNAALCGLVIAYPEVNLREVPPVPYPPCVLAERAENVSVQDCLLLHPYEGIRLVGAARHLVRNVMGYPIWRGIYVDECYDIGRIENVHFWPFGVRYEPEDPFCQWINLNGVAFEFARTDWHYVHNTFCFGYGVGYKFSRSKAGSANGNFLGIGADCCERAVLVEDCQPPGLLITNGEFVGRWTSREAVTVEILPTAGGLISLVNCSFWGPIDRCVVQKASQSQLVLSACHFCEWDVGMRGAAAIELLAGRAMLQACTFRQGARWHLRVGPQVAGVVLLGLQAPGRLFVDNQAGDRTTAAALAAEVPRLESAARRHYRLRVGQPGDEAYLLFWHGPEHAQRSFRWSSGRSLLLLPVQPGEEYQVVLEAEVPAHLPPGAFGVYLGEEKLADIRSGRTEFRLQAKSRSELPLEIRGPAWVPAERDKRSSDQRPLGILLFSVTLRSLQGSDIPAQPVILNP
jgi:hypothetical protein